MERINLNILFMPLVLAIPLSSGAEEQPTTDFYGSLRVGVNIVDAGTSYDGANGRDYLSRLGLKAKFPIRDGLEGIAQVEYGLRSDNKVDFQQNGDTTLRLAMIGLK